MYSKFLNRFIIAFTIFIILVFFMGCGAIKPQAPVCETDQPSVLCAATAQLSELTGKTVTLDDLSLALKIGNISALENKVYSAQGAIDFIDDCDDYLNTHNSLTYGDFISEVTARYLKLLPAVQSMFIILSDEYEVDIATLNKEPLTAYDYYLLRKHLEKQRQIVVPYLYLE